MSNFLCMINFTATNTPTVCVVNLVLFLSSITAFSYCNLICGLMVSVISTNSVDSEFEPQWGQTKDYTTGICCFSTLYAALRSSDKKCLI